jgi:hypothetical protein
MLDASTPSVLVSYAPNIRFQWIERDRILTKACEGFVAGDALRRTYSEAAAFMERNAVARVLSDNRGLFPTRAGDLAWIEQHFLPRVLLAGWRSWAVLGPTTPLGTMNMRRWLDVYGGAGVEIRTFESGDAAVAWLREQPDAGARAARAVGGR